MHVFLDQTHDTAPNSASIAEATALLSLQCPFTVEQMSCECDDLLCFAALFKIQVAIC